MPKNKGRESQTECWKSRNRRAPAVFHLERAMGLVVELQSLGVYLFLKALGDISPYPLEILGDRNYIETG